MKYTPDQQKQIQKLTAQYENRGYRVTGAEKAEAVIRRQVEAERKEAEREAAKRNRKN